MSDLNSHLAAQKPKSVVGPDGKMLTLSDLPPPNTQRWVARRKAEVVTAVRAGLLSLDLPPLQPVDRGVPGLGGSDRQARARRLAGHADPGLSLTRDRGCRTSTARGAHRPSHLTVVC
jgi:hypothetical protein